MANDAPFDFKACESAGKCRPDMEAMIPAKADWVEIHCGRCKATGILRRASDAAPATAPGQGVRAGRRPRRDAARFGERRVTIPVSHSVPHVSREGEWMASAVLMAFAMALLLPGPTFSRPIFVNMAAVAPEGTWGMGLLLVATVRMIGLWVNGNWRRSPTLRFLGASAGAAIWFSFGRLFSDDGYPGVSTGCLVYTTIGVFDLFFAVRSLLDQGRNDQRHSLARRGA